jgi:hypothetical protein
LQIEIRKTGSFQEVGSIAESCILESLLFDKDGRQKPMFLGQTAHIQDMGLQRKDRAVSDPASAPFEKNAAD